MEIKLGFLYVGDASIVEGHMKICSNGAVCTPVRMRVHPVDLARSLVGLAIWVDGSGSGRSD
jgi:hypothetical protein